MIHNFWWSRSDVISIIPKQRIAYSWTIFNTRSFEALFNNSNWRLEHLDLPTELASELVVDGHPSKKHLFKIDNFHLKMIYLINKFCNSPNVFQNPRRQKSGEDILQSKLTFTSKVGFKKYLDEIKFTWR